MKQKPKKRVVKAWASITKRGTLVCAEKTKIGARSSAWYGDREVPCTIIYTP